MHYDIFLRIIQNIKGILTNRDSCINRNEINKYQIISDNNKYGEQCLSQPKYSNLINYLYYFQPTDYNHFSNIFLPESYCS